jgi:Glycosyltransferases, probably involved in cell wall biogenesis
MKLMTVSRENLRISVVVVTYNEEKNIEDCIMSLLKLDYPKEKHEIVVIDGKSQDRTGTIVLKYVNRDNRVRFFENPKRTIASNRNVGISKARFEYIAFTDADCTVPRDWLLTLVNAYNTEKERTKLGAVGGGNILVGNPNSFSEAVGLAMNSYLSSLGTVQGKIYEQSKRVDSLACLNVLYSKSVLEDAGGFSEALANMTEDYELNYRIRQRGYKLLYIPNANVYHKSRTTLIAFLRQMYLYGKGRARLTLLNPKTFKLIYFLPILFIVLMLGAIISTIWLQTPVCLLPLAAYGVLILGISLLIALNSRKLHRVFPIALVFVIIHWGYSAGELIGFLSPFCRQRM